MSRSWKIAATLAGLVVTNSVVSAANYYWNPATPSGNWVINAYWSVGAPGTYNQSWFNNNNSAIFSGEDQIVNLDSIVTVVSMDFTADGIQISDGGGSIFIHGSVPISVSGTDIATINAPLISVGVGVVMVKQGPGTLVLSGANNINTVNVDAGTLRLGGNSAIASAISSSSLIVNGTLDLAGYSASRSGLTGSGVITNSGAQASTLTLGTSSSGTSNYGGVIQNGTSQVNLIKSQSNTQILSGANTFMGTTTVNAGTLAASNATAIGSSTLVLNGGNFSTSVATVGAGGVTIAGGTLRLNAGSAGALALSAGSDFSMTGGTWALQLAEGADQITGSGMFSITGGTLDLGGGEIDYDQSYTLFSGFSSGSVSGLTISNYSSEFLASLGDDGVLSFTAVPEPAIMMLGALVPVAFLRRRRIHDKGPGC
ncbi:autotransporter-associated beta strand repeat-containing protein [Luteolibacter pohnpeiensis]|uniref:Autotransporter-associated beta strand repeat-containing protein n=1 Tax=Luteolibacter pohnpeiensis TaxID=454153 RepID=A0A934VT06_9BACT|nr:PEP-CTERM sorting domain-containing protein [Luteolibacter pohnpeiensis]MBK1880987.1 autotransporter-associated beta strand repeat-containing protein [Luteolibacter pohnpeiensis]